MTRHLFRPTPLPQLPNMQMFGSCVYSGWFRVSLLPPPRFKHTTQRSSCSFAFLLLCSLQSAYQLLLFESSHALHFISFKA